MVVVVLGFVVRSSAVGKGAAVVNRRASLHIRVTCSELPKQRTKSGGHQIAATPIRVGIM